METRLPASRIWRFGPYEIDLVTGELRKRGFRVPLQEQPRRILGALLEANGSIVSREELCRRLWPQGTFVDFEHSLNAAVRRLRAALGEDADVPRFIETVPGRGYRFALVQGRTKLAVLPFSIHGIAPPEDGADAAGGLFVDGLVDEITIQLARACPASVGVIARHAVADSGTLQIAANYVVEGTVRRVDRRVRITVGLTDLQEHTHLWAASYDSSLEDALSVQTDVAATVAAEIGRLFRSGRLGGELSKLERRRERLARVGARGETQLDAGLESGERRLQKIMG